MRIVRSVSGHVSPIHYLKPAPLRSRRITSVHRYYGRLRLPSASALSLALYTCRRVRDLLRRCWGLLGYRTIVMSGSIRSEIPGGQARLAIPTPRRVRCCLLASISHRPLPMRPFRDYNLHGRLYPLPLRLACFLAYASSDPLLDSLQGWILGPWLAVTKAGFTPARLCDIAKPQHRPDPKKFQEVPTTEAGDFKGLKEELEDIYRNVQIKKDKQSR